jgi:hypothetical protein
MGREPPTEPGSGLPPRNLPRRDLLGMIERAGEIGATDFDLPDPWASPTVAGDAPHRQGDENAAA